MERGLARNENASCNESDQRRSWNEQKEHHKDRPSLFYPFLAAQLREVFIKVLRQLPRLLPSFSLHSRRNFLFRTVFGFHIICGPFFLVRKDHASLCSHFSRLARLIDVTGHSTAMGMEGVSASTAALTNGTGDETHRRIKFQYMHAKPSTRFLSTID